MKSCARSLWSGLFLLAGAVLLWPCNAGGTTITFDDKGFVNFDDVTTQYAAQGVTFQGFDHGQPVAVEVIDNTVFGDMTPPSPPMTLMNLFNHDPGERADVMAINFLAPASDIEFDYNGAGWEGSNTIFNLYNSSNALVGTFNVPGATDSNFHHVVAPGTNIGRLEILQPEDWWGYGIDNLSFQPTPVPAPGAVLLGLLGVVLVGRLRRRGSI